MKWKIEEISELRGFVIEWAEPGHYLLSRRNKLYRSRDLIPPFEELTVIDAPLWRSLASSFRLVQRLLRFSVTNAIPLANGDIFVAFDRTVGIIRGHRYIALSGLKRPCRVLRSACAIGLDGNLYFGEYLANDSRGSINLYRYVPGEKSVNSIYSFPKGSVRHVHGIYYDEFTHALFCLTGDSNAECRIIRTFDEFGTVETICQGDESWRAVSALFTKEGVYFGTDAEYRSNSIYRLDRQTLIRNSLGEVNGTVFYSQKFNGKLFFATTAENAPSQTENRAEIWVADESDGIQKLGSFAKDRWHAVLFGFGIVNFPHISSVSDRLFFSLSATIGDNRTFEIILNN